MEIERKYLIGTLPQIKKVDKAIHIEQGYVSISPVIRIRRTDDSFFLTIKGKGLIAREEYEMEIGTEEYVHLSTKVDYPLILKTRYLIPVKDYTIELDVFHGHLNGLILAEVEFDSMEAADNFSPPSWFGKDVSSDARFQNNHLCQIKDIERLLR